MENNFTNQTEVTDFADTKNIQAYVVVFFSVSNGLLGLIANTVTIAAILHGKLYKHSGFVKILNLLVCNLIHCAIFLPLMAVEAFTGLWTNHAGLCNLVSFGLFCNLGTELLGYTSISLNRYFCIVNNRLYKMLYGKTWLLAVEWVVSWSIYPVILALPLFNVWSHYEFHPRKMLCHPFLGRDCTGYCLFVFGFAILSTVPVITYCYLWIIVTYFKAKRQLLHNQDSGLSNSHRSTFSHQSEHARQKSEHKMAFTILAVIVFFSLFRVPFLMLYIYDPSMTKVNPIVHTSLIYAGTILNWVNPIIYALTNTHLRTSMNKMLKCNR